MVTQEELRNHLQRLGWTKVQSSKGTEIPQEVLLVSSRPLTPAEKAYARTIQPVRE